ncbi:hypothetical protein IV203_033302 [Nitzschia inconspicua]|uniref:Uncharacterized protein n=1 Tax=Nitzschia inconspicua TaxID=303405 RepID=A0A9K3KLZ8_9STRA|nr:hypothetical protein IV203_033302 [Nitzschia inconspicua]
MGGSASQPIEATGAEAEHESVFSLSAKMQQQLAQEFHNEQIIKLFGKQIEAIGERRAQILESSLEQRAQLEQKLTAFRQQNQKVQAKLDATLEGLEDKFTDTANAVEYDIERLEQQYLGGRHKVMAPMTYCGQERLDIVACYTQQSSNNNNNANPLACDAFVKALTKCTEKTVFHTDKE